MRVRFIAITVLILLALPYRVGAGDADSLKWGQFDLNDLRLLAPSGRVWQLVEDSVPIIEPLEWMTERFRDVTDTTFYRIDTIGWTYTLVPRLVEPEPVDTVCDTIESGGDHDL